MISSSKVTIINRKAQLMITVDLGSGLSSTSNDKTMQLSDASLSRARLTRRLLRRLTAILEIKPEKKLRQSEIKIKNLHVIS